jgi:hypothetical protein
MTSIAARALVSLLIITFELHFNDLSRTPIFSHVNYCANGCILHPYT